MLKKFSKTNPKSPHVPHTTPTYVTLPHSPLPTPPTSPHLTIHYPIPLRHPSTYIPAYTLISHLSIRAPLIHYTTNKSTRHINSGGPPTFRNLTKGGGGGGRSGI
jgi:hypothetical protein